MTEYYQPFQNYLQERMKSLELKTYHLSQLTGLSSTHINKLINKDTNHKAINQPNRKTIIFVLLALGSSLTEINYYLEEFGYSQIRDDRIAYDIEIFDDYVNRLSKNFGGFYPIKTGLHLDLASYAIDSIHGESKIYSNAILISLCESFEKELLAFLNTDDMLSQFKKKLKASDLSRYYFFNESMSNALETALNERRLKSLSEILTNSALKTQFMIGSKQLHAYLSPFAKLMHLYTDESKQLIILQSIQKFLLKLLDSQVIFIRNFGGFNFVIKTFQEEGKNETQQILSYMVHSDLYMMHRYQSIEDYAKQDDLAGYLVNDPRLIKNFEEEWKRLESSKFNTEDYTKFTQLIQNLKTIQDFEQLIAFL